MKMTNFIGEVIDAIEVRVTNIMVGSKTFSLAFFMMDVKPSYFALLGRDWIHSNQLVPLTLD